MNCNKKVMTFTFGELSENSVGMEQIGLGLGEKGSGFSCNDLEVMRDKFENLGGECEMYNINDLIGGDGEDAKLLVIRKGVNVMMGDEEYDKKMFEEYLGLEWDKKCLMRGRVVNKLARWNLCFSDYEQNGDYENGKGRVYDVNKLKYGNFREGGKFYDMFGDKSKNLEMEGNYYFDKDKCGIGWHGDGERRKVIGLRLGGSLDLRFKWFKNSESVGELFEVVLNSGDIYIMSEKCVGNDWKKRSILTLRHSVGGGRFAKINCDERKKKREKEKEKENIVSSRDVGNSSRDVGNSSRDVGNSSRDVGNSSRDVGNSSRDVGK